MTTTNKKQHIDIKHYTNKEIGTSDGSGSNTSAGKFGIVLLGIGIFTVAIIGYSYYDSSKSSDNISDSLSTYSKTSSTGTCNITDANIQGGACSATQNSNVATTTTKGGCACCSGKKKTQTTATNTNNTVNSNLTYEAVNISHDGRSTSPESTTLKAGNNYKFVITPASDGKGCMSNLTIPGIDNNIYDIKKGNPITIIINNAKVGNYDIVCGTMGMYQGKIIIQ